MPIALHPDPLVAIILPASAYPLEIVQAARFIKDTNNLSKIDEQPWDDNVKQLARFPDMIAKMDADLQWTMQLGQAFIEQQKEVMDTIQSLRLKAQKAGTLQSTPQQVVTVTNVIVLETNVTQVVNVTKEVVEVRPSNPEVIYVPTYPPTVYYPPPAYVYNPLAPLVTFGAGMAVGAIIANNCDWHHGNVDVDVDRNVNRNVNRNTDRSANRTQGTSTQKWQPDQNRMKTSGAQSASSREARGWSGGGSTQMASGNRPSTGTAGARPSTGTTGARASAGDRPTSSARQTPSPTGRSSPSASPSTRSRSSGGSSAFSGMSSGSNSRSYSNRGASSRSGSGVSSGRSGGGGRGGGGRR